jgi:flagellar capping protein FliD
MAKSTGLGQTTLSVDDAGGTARDIRNDITNWQMSTPRGVQDVTGVDKSANERLLLLADASITLNGVHNPSSNRQHDVFKTVPSTSVARTVTVTINGVTLATEMLFSDYQLNRSDSGELTWSAPGSLADGTVPTWA